MSQKSYINKVENKLTDDNKLCVTSITKRDYLVSNIAH